MGGLTARTRPMLQPSLTSAPSEWPQRQSIETSKADHSPRDAWINSLSDEWLSPPYRLTANPVHSARTKEGDPTKRTARHQLQWLLQRPGGRRIKGAGEAGGQTAHRTRSRGGLCPLLPHRQPGHDLVHHCQSDMSWLGVVGWGGIATAGEEEVVEVLVDSDPHLGPVGQGPLP